MLPEEGHWAWSHKNRRLEYVKHEPPVSHKVLKSTLRVSKLSGPTHAVLNIKFRESPNSVDQAQFRRILRRSSPVEGQDVVTLEDVKAVVLYQSVGPLPATFVQLFHEPRVDRLLRALIIYFQQFLLVWEYLIKRRKEGASKIQAEGGSVAERVIRKDLGMLRSMVSREYCALLIGAGRLHRYHHLANKLGLSALERDITLYELLYRMSCRVVWLALGKHHLGLIEYQLNLLFRSDVHNLVKNQSVKVYNPVDLTKNELDVLSGPDEPLYNKFMLRSPLALELLETDYDYRVLALGLVDIPSDDPRVKYLMDLYTAPEELLPALMLNIGILGQPRSLFDTTLNMIQISKEDNEGLLMPEYGPPEQLPAVFPKDEFSFKITKTVKKSLLKWILYKSELCKLYPKE